MSAIGNARRLDEIGFPEFTAGLIGSTFDALISANIRQMEAYNEMVDASKTSLKDYINNTKDDITGDEILRLLETILPAKSTDGEQTSRVYEGATLDAEETAKLNKALLLPAESETTNATVSAGKIKDEAAMDAILDAVANRVSVNKYDLLTSVINQGLLRIVVENGQLETRLHFSAWDRQSYTRKASSYDRKTYSKTKGKSGGLFSSLFSGPSLSVTRNTALSVKTASSSANSSSGSNVHIFGGVKLNFKTDYQPLPDND